MALLVAPAVKATRYLPNDPASTQELPSPIIPDVDQVDAEAFWLFAEADVRLFSVLALLDASELERINAENRIRLFEESGSIPRPVELAAIRKLASGVLTCGSESNIWETGDLAQDCGSPSFQGLWTDPSTGIAYARNRWYDARNASWLSEDPLGAVDSVNLYAFVGWGPHMGRDPMGLTGGIDPNSGAHELLLDEAEQHAHHKAETLQAGRDLRFLTRWDVFKYNFTDPTYSQDLLSAATRLLWSSGNVPLTAPGMCLMVEPHAMVTGPTKVLRAKKAADALELVDEVASGSKKVGQTIPEVEYLVDEAGRTVRAEGKISGPHRGRRKGYRPEPPGGRDPGEHRGHLIPEGGVENPKLVNVKENIVSETSKSNLGPKKRLDNLVSRLAAADPDSVVRMRAEPLYRKGETRPFAISYSVTKDEEIVHAVSILNQ